MGATQLSVNFSDELVDAFADAVVKRIANQFTQLPDNHDDRWLDSQEAAQYLGITRNALHKHTSAMTIPFSQDSDGGKCFFKRSALDAWRLSNAKGQQCLTGVTRVRSACRAQGPRASAC